MNLTTEQRARLAKAAGREWDPDLSPSGGWPTLRLDELFGLTERLAVENGLAVTYTPWRDSKERWEADIIESGQCEAPTLREAMEQAVLAALEANDDRT